MHVLVRAWYKTWIIMSSNYKFTHHKNDVASIVSSISVNLIELCVKANFSNLRNFAIVQAVIQRYVNNLSCQSSCHSKISHS